MSEEKKTIYTAMEEGFTSILTTMSGISQHEDIKIVDNIICFIGAAGGVGTSTIVANQAKLMEKLGLTVLVIDMNILYPAQNILFHVEYKDKQPDLVSFLLGDCEIGQAIVTKKGKRVSILSAHDRQLIDYINCDKEQVARNLENMLGKIKYEFDMILIDCPNNLGYDPVSSALYRSDSFYVVWDESVGCVANFDVFSKVLNNLGLNSARIKAIMNKKTGIYYPKSTFRALGLDVVGTLPYEQSVIESSLRGEIYVEKGASFNSTAKKYISNMEQIMYSILTAGGYGREKPTAKSLTVGQEQEAEEKGGLFGGLFSKKAPKEKAPKAKKEKKKRESKRDKTDTSISLTKSNTETEQSDFTADFTEEITAKKPFEDTEPTLYETSAIPQPGAKTPSLDAAWEDNWEDDWGNPEAEVQTVTEPASNETILKSAELSQKELEEKIRAEVEETLRKEAEQKAEARARERAQSEMEARRKAELAAKRKAEEEARRKAHQEAKEKARAEAEAKAKAEEARLKAEAEAKAKEKARAEAEAKAKAEEARLKAEAEAKAKEKARAEAEAKAKAEEARLKAEAEAKAKAEEARLKAEAEAKARAKAEAELRAKIEAEMRAKMEAEIQAKIEAELKAQFDTEN